MFLARGISRKVRKLVLLNRCGRFYSSAPSSRDVRQEFLDFFIKSHDHTFVPSSSVVPYGDASLSFVNAGMNQFKPIFLGQAIAQQKRAVNSQKCIRVGGKHNDLDDVGRDGYHHTFFEMLGSWSFNDYFKQEACQMAWELLTQVYKIPKNLLYITYFGGNTALGLPEDEECKHIWLSLGVAPDHVLPFGMKDNFWEMGLVGPCGPCSEIHVNKTDLDPNLARNLVNQGTEDVVEIWNLVFMQYNRISNELLEKLPAHHIDTGMGLERLAAFLQNKKSNYDTDLFMPLIGAIHQMSGGEPYRSNYETDTVQGQRDCAYRLLADHSRMITVALADGAFPDTNHRLRRVIRQALVTGRKWFEQDVTLMLELSQRVSDMLSQVYPEIARNLNNVRTLLRFEDEMFREQLAKSGREWTDMVKRHPELSALPVDQQPGLVAGLRELNDRVRSHGAADIPGQLAFRLYNTYGLHEDSMLLLSRLNGWTIDWTTFRNLMEEARMNTLLQSATPVSRAQFLCPSLNVTPTRSVCHESYSRSSDGSYKFAALDANVTALVSEDGTLVDSAENGDRVALVADKTCFYYEAGGQVSDSGWIAGPSGLAQLEDVRHVGEHIFHIVRVTGGTLGTGQHVRMELDEARRIKTMANHTATHLLQAALKDVLHATCQKSSHVSAEYLRFDFAFFQSDLSAELISRVETKVRNWIRHGLAVERTVLPLQRAAALPGITLLPGECYPDVVSVIRVAGQNGDGDVVSLEPCCGTHVRNTADIEEFAIVSARSSGVGSRTVRAVTRSFALEAIDRAKDLDAQLDRLEQTVRESKSSGTSSSQLLVPVSCQPAHDSFQSSDASLQEINETWKKLKVVLEEALVPVVASRQILARLEEIESVIRASAQEELARTMQEQVERAVEAAQSQGFVVAALEIPPKLLEIGGAKLSLIKATRHCPDKPVLVFAWDGDYLVGRCAVPQAAVTRDLDAEKWGTHVLRTLGGRGSPPKGQDSRFSFNLRSRRGKTDRRSAQDLAVRSATEFCRGHV